MSTDHHDYDDDDLPPVGARVRHYVDGDTGTVAGYFPVRSGRRPSVDVRWDSDPKVLHTHFADELSAE